MKLLVLLTAVVASAAILATAPLGAAAPKQQIDRSVPVQVKNLRGGIRWNIRRTHHWQDLRGVGRTPSAHAEWHVRAVGYLRWDLRKWTHRRVRAKRNYLAYRASHAEIGGAVPHIICSVFHGQTVKIGTGGYVSASCEEALHIAWGESRDTTGAANGQYLGLFQMGASERATYATIGYSTAYEQTIAAFNLFSARGWEPWTCCGE